MTTQVASSPFPVSKNVTRMKPSSTLAAMQAADALRSAGVNVVDFGAGEPDFSTPAFVMSAAHRALDAGATRYTQVEGILALREVIAERASALHGGEPITADQIVVAAGTKRFWRQCRSHPRLYRGVGRSSRQPRLGPSAQFGDLLATWPATALASPPPGAMPGSTA